MSDDASDKLVELSQAINDGIMTVDRTVKNTTETSISLKCMTIKYCHEDGYPETLNQNFDPFPYPFVAFIPE